MKQQTPKKYFIYYQTKDGMYNFVYSIKVCKRPELTKDYKTLKLWLASDIVSACGWCTNDYYEDYLGKFVNIF